MFYLCIFLLDTPYLFIRIMNILMWDIYVSVSLCTAAGYDWHLNGAKLQRAMCNSPRKGQTVYLWESKESLSRCFIKGHRGQCSLAPPTAEFTECRQDDVLVFFLIPQKQILY